MYPKPKYSPYLTLRLGPNATRLVRLLPHEGEDSQIRCELFNYTLRERSGRKHLYEALSYVWGSESKPCTIFLNGVAFPVTQNLHTALSHLRDPQLERTIWIDAICIDQDNDDEKSIQIPLMRAIYAQADRVIVWLGEAVENGDNALRTIHHFAKDQSHLLAQSGGTSNDACLKLLQREWFQRIWVLQEVGVARCISMVCGSVQINGHVFCEGLGALGHSLNLPRTIRPVVHLIRGALFRSSYEIDSRGTLAIGELLDMYHNHHATILHDKVYALLGLSVEYADNTALKPNYRLPWNDVFKKVAMHVFPGICSVETWPEIPVAVIEGRGWILGYVDSVEQSTSKYGYQQININYNHVARLLGYNDIWGTQWTLQASAEPIQEGNIIFLLQGSPRPIIIELCNDHFTVIVSTVTLQPEGNAKIPDMVPAQNSFTIQKSVNDIYMTWKLSLADKESNSGLRYQRELNSVAPHYQEKNSAKAKRLHSISHIVGDIIIQILKKEDFEDQMRYLLQQCGESLPIPQDVVKAAAADEGRGYIILRQLCVHFGKSLNISEDVVQAAAANTGDGYRIMCELRECFGESLPISEDVVKAAAANHGNGYSILCQLREYFGESLPISEDVVKAAAANEGDGYRIICLLCEHFGESLPISEEVVKAATANQGVGYRIICQLCEHFGESLPISENIVKAAAANQAMIISQLCEYFGESLPISEDTVKVAAANQRGGYRIICQLREYFKESLPISEDVVKAAAANERDGYRIIRQLCKHFGESLPISENIVKAAAANQGGGCGVLWQLRKHFGESLPISENIVKAAAANQAMIIRQLCEYFGESLPISEDVVKAAAANQGDGYGIIRQLCEYFGESLPISEDVVKAAAANQAMIIRQLCDHFGESLPISEDVVKAAAANQGDGYKVLQQLRKHFGESLPISESIVKAAAANQATIIRQLCDHFGDSLPISEDVVKAAAANQGDGCKVLQQLCEHFGESLPSYGCTWTNQSASPWLC